MELPVTVDFNKVIPETPSKNYNLDEEHDTFDGVDVNSEDDKSVTHKKEIFISYFQPGTWVHVKPIPFSKSFDPQLVDFFSECKSKYIDESRFIVKYSEYAFRKLNTNEASNNLNETNSDAFQTNEPERTDPLAKTIRSITDRLVLQQLIADPRSYLKPGGNDMYYDQDDPFLDDQELYKESNWKKNFELSSSSSSSVAGDYSEIGSHADSFIFGAQDLKLDPSVFVFDNDPERDMPAIEKDAEEITFNPSGWKYGIQHIPPSCIKFFERLEGKLQQLPDTGVDTKTLWELMKKEIKEVLNSLCHPTRLPDDGMIVWENNATINNNSKATEASQDSTSQQFTHTTPIKAKRRVGFVQINSKSLSRLIKCFRRITNAVTKRQICKYWTSLMLNYNYALLCKNEDNFINLLKASKLFEQGNQSYVDKIRFYINHWKKEKTKRATKGNEIKDKYPSNTKNKTNPHQIMTKDGSMQKSQPPPTSAKESKRDNLLVGFQNKQKTCSSVPIPTYCKALASIAEDLLKYAHLLNSYRLSVRSASMVFFEILGEKLQTQTCELFPQVFSDLLKAMFQKRFKVTLVVPREFIADVLKIYQDLYQLDNYILRKFKRPSQVKHNTNRAKKQATSLREDTSQHLKTSQPNVTSGPISQEFADPNSYNRKKAPDDDYEANRNGNTPNFNIQSHELATKGTTQACVRTPDFENNKDRCEVMNSFSLNSSCSEKQYSNSFENVSLDLKHQQSSSSEKIDDYKQDIIDIDD